MGNNDSGQVPAGIQPLPQEVTRYDGPPRFPPSTANSDNILPIRDYEYARLISATQFAGFDVSDDNKKLIVKPLRCTYELSQQQRAINFWNTPRPLLPARVVREVNQSGLLMADVTIVKCPEFFGDALKAGFGSDFLAERKAARDKVVSEAEKRRAATIKYQEAQREKVDNWMKGARPNPREKDAQIIAQLERIVADLEVKKKSLTFNAFRQVVTSQVDPLMVDLGRSVVGHAKTIPAGEAGRPQFESMDNGPGFAVVWLNRRLRALSKGAWNGTMSERVWSHTVDEVYKTQLDDKGAFNPAYSKALLSSIEKYRDSSRSGSPPSTESIRSSRIVTLRPRESLLYRAISKATQAAIDIAQIRARNKQYAADLTKTLQQARAEFWRCAKSRCADGGALWIDYSKLLIAKDKYYAFQYYMEAMTERVGAGQRGANGAMMNQFMGIDDPVDGGMIPGCEQDYDNYLGGIGNLIAKSNGSGMVNANALDESFNGEKYLAVQQCRDRMEYILRPR